MTWFYLHTIDDQPAYFNGEQLVFARGTYARRPQPLVQSLAQIRHEQKLDRAYRTANNLGQAYELSYVRVSLPRPTIGHNTAKRQK